MELAQPATTAVAADRDHGEEEEEVARHNNNCNDYVIMDHMPKTTQFLSLQRSRERNDDDDDSSSNNDDPHERKNGGGDGRRSISPSPSLVSSVLTADGIHDYTGFLCVCLVILIGDMSRGVMFPSLWPLVQSLDGTKVFQGYTVAAFSFCRIITKPIFGSLSHTLGYTKSLLISCTLLLIGTILYAQIPNMGSLHFLISSQMVLGMGSGTLGITRAFVADVTAKRQRTTYMAWSEAVQYTGFTVFPVVGAIFNKAYGERSYSTMGGLVQFNMFTAPAHFMSAMVMITIVVLLIFFQGRVRHVTAKGKSQKRLAIDERANATVFSCCPELTGCQLTVYDCCILSCMLLNLATKGSIASFETLGIAIAQQHFGLESSRAGVIISMCGALGVVCLLHMDGLERRFADVYIILGGILAMGAGIAGLILIPQQPRDDGDNDDENNGESNNNPAWGFALAMFLIYSVGYPIGHTALVGLFSKSTFVRLMILSLCAQQTHSHLAQIALLACGTFTQLSADDRRELY
jgi:MFS transporter, ceroid-lipofuscinosis neuronal protein 7